MCGNDIILMMIITLKVGISHTTSFGALLESMFWGVEDDGCGSTMISNCF